MLVGIEDPVVDSGGQPEIVRIDDKTAQHRLFPSDSKDLRHDDTVCAKLRPRPLARV